MTPGPEEIVSVVPLREINSHLIESVPELMKRSDSPILDTEFADELVIESNSLTRESQPQARTDSLDSSRIRSRPGD